MRGAAKGGAKRCPVDGVAVAGHTKAPSKRTMKYDTGGVVPGYNMGGYAGGLTETGRGTMAGELGRRGDMSVREAGETMHELAKRRRGFDTGGGVSAFVAANAVRDTVSAALTKKKKKKKKDK